MTDWESYGQPKQKQKTDWENYGRVEVSPSTQQAWQKTGEGALQGLRQSTPGRGELPIQYEKSKGAKLLDLIAAGTADQPEYQVRYLAAKRFPDIPIEQAMSRYGSQNGKIFYVGDDGKLYSETPNIVDRFFMASSKALPIAGGTAAGVAAAPMVTSGPAGVAGAMGIASAGGAAGEGIRQEIGRQLTGEPISTGEIATEAGFAAGGEFVGALFSKILGRQVARDVSRMNPEDVKVLKGLADKYGIELTPAELTNLPTLKAQQKALGNLTPSADTMADFYTKRSFQVDDAVGKALQTVSTVDSPEIAGQLVRTAAKNAMDDIASQKAAQASPLYRKAFQSSGEVNTKSVLDLIDSELKNAKGSMKAQLQRARKLLVQEISPEEKAAAKASGVDIQDIPDTSLVGNHYAKMELDNMIDTARESGVGKTTKRQLVAIKNKLLSEMDNVSPEYKAARKIYADLAPVEDSIREGVVGVIADLKDTRLQTIASKLFDPKNIGPESAKKARMLLRGADPEGWQAIKRAWLQNQWDHASKEFSTVGNLNRGAKFRALLFGDRNRQNLMKELLDPQEYKMLDEIGKVLEASGRVKPVGSDTAWNQEVMRVERNAAGSPLSMTAKAIRVWGWPKLVEDWATERNMAQIAQRTAQIITSPNAMKNLKALQTVGPTSARAAVLTAHLLGIGTAAAGDEVKREILQ